MDCILKSDGTTSNLALTYDKPQLSYVFRMATEKGSTSGKEDAIPNANVQTFDASSDADDGCSWLSLRPICFPTGQQHHDLIDLKVIATARNVELYIGANSSGRTYIKTVRGAPIDASGDLDLDVEALKEMRGDGANGGSSNYFSLVVFGSDVDDGGGGGPGAMRYLHLKFLSLRPVGCTRVTVAQVRVRVGAQADAANAVQPVARRSAAASGGAGGVPEISADTLALLLGGGGGGGGGGARPGGGAVFSASAAAAPSGPPEAPAVPSPAAAPAAAAAPGGVVGSAFASLMPAMLSQIGALLDVKLSPVLRRLDAMELQLAGLARLVGHGGRAGEREREGGREGERVDDDRPPN